MLDTFTTLGDSLLGGWWAPVWALIKIVALVAPLMVCVAYLTLWERKAIGWTQIRPGPNRARPGPHAVCQARLRCAGSNLALGGGHDASASRSACCCHAIVRAMPSRMDTRGAQPSSPPAIVMSGLRRVGSSCGNG